MARSPEAADHQFPEPPHGRFRVVKIGCQTADDRSHTLEHEVVRSGKLVSAAFRELRGHF